MIGDEPCRLAKPADMSISRMRRNNAGKRITFVRKVVHLVENIHSVIADGIRFDQKPMSHSCQRWNKNAPTENQSIAHQRPQGPLHRPSDRGSHGRHYLCFHPCLSWKLGAARRHLFLIHTAQVTVRQKGEH
jgi:hypothetical protein